MPEETLPNQNNLTTPTQPQMAASQPTVINNKPAPQGKSPILKWIFIGVIAVLILAGIAGAYILGAQKSDNTTSAISPTSIPTTNLKTYENQKYTIKYPDGWKPMEEQMMTNIDPNQVTIYPPNYENDNYGQIYIRIKENPDSLNTEEWIKQNKGDWCFGNNLDNPGIKSSEIKVDGKIGIELIIESLSNCAPVSLIMISKGNELYEIFTNAQSNENKAIFYDILSNFKFKDVSSIDTSGWKIYSNTAGKYSISYPTDYKLNVNETAGVDGVMSKTPNTIQLISPEIGNTKSNFALSITHSPTTSKNVNDFVDNKSSCIDVKSQNGEKYKLNDLNALLFENVNCGPWPQSEIYAVKNGIGYVITIESTTEPEKIMENVYQILSTLKFN